jgi:thermostable 8-oxoguanine DNA glycosylase
MSTIETLAREAGEVFLKSLPHEIRDETVRQGVCKVAEERFRMGKLREEMSFEKEMLICILTSPKHAKLAQKLELPREILEDIKEDLEEADKLIRALDVWKASMVKNSYTFSLHPENFSFDNQITQARVEFEEGMNEGVQEYKHFTAQDWTTIKYDLQKKGVAISHDFINRCQRVAQSTLAA